MHGASRKAGRAAVTPAGLRSAEAGTPEPCGTAQMPPRCAIICSANGLFNEALSTHPRCDGGIGKLGGSARRIRAASESGTKTTCPRICALRSFAATGESESRAGTRRIGVRGANGLSKDMCLAQLRCDGENEKVEANAPTHLRRIEIEDANGLSKDMCLAQLRCDGGNQGSRAGTRAASGSGTQTACPRICALRNFAATGESESWAKARAASGSGTQTAIS